MAKNQQNITHPLVTIFTFTTITSLFLLVFSVTDSIRPKDTIKGNETLVSANGLFELGFFGDVVSGSYYLGIWFKSDPKRKPVWIANRENPTLGTSGVLQLRPENGNLVIVDQRQTPWLINSAGVATTPNTSATLLDTGNLILREERNKTSTIIWQSFDNPTDTFLPGMKLGWFGLNTDEPPRFQYVVSWVSPQNPSHGPFTLGVDNSTRKKLVVWRGNSAQMEIGYWEKEGKFRLIFENSSYSAMDSGYNFSYVTNKSENYFSFSVNGDKYGSKWFVIESTGNLVEYSMAIDGKISYVSHRLCAEHPSKGNNGKCLTSVPSACENGDVFTQMNGMVIPTSFYVSGSINWGFSDCEFMCRSNCSCSAFAFQDDRLTGCQLFYGSNSDLLNIVENGDGVVYVRGDNNVAKPSDITENKWKLRLAIVIPLAFLLVIILILWGYMRWRKREAGEHRQQNISGNNEEMRLFQMGSNNMPPMHDGVIRATDKFGLNTSQKEQDLPLFTFSSIVSATNYFATANKLGEGGFGPVYKGILPDGQVIAVKRLSKISRQGSDEFKNEVSLISKLQHRNLVRLLGCCIDAEESILVYEYMPNKSLDSFIFDSTKRELLDWRKRLNIIEGIAQGLLYLHKYSRLRIIHRDLKTSNILLDSEMNPKISDFGMARIFADNETRVKTNRVVGTYGYMSPEYAMDGLFSEKSDVFSFGVIMLEIISGKKNIAFFETDHSLNLLGNAWHLWLEGNSTGLMDSTLLDSCSTGEVSRYVQLGLLCVQERAIDRPTMSDVVFMLSKETLDLPLPKEPAFLSQINSTDAESSSSRQKLVSRNDMTISEVHAR